MTLSGWRSFRTINVELRQPDNKFFSILANSKPKQQNTCNVPTHMPTIYVHIIYVCRRSELSNNITR